MKFFSPTAFGSLHLAFGLKESSEIPLDFVKSLRSSPSAGRFQRLHFYVSSGKKNVKVFEKIIEAISVDSLEISGRPWCENLLPFVEVPGHAEIIRSNSEMVFVKDRFPKVTRRIFVLLTCVCVREAHIICVYQGNGSTLGGV